MRVSIHAREMEGVMEECSLICERSRYLGREINLFKIHSSGPTREVNILTNLPLARLGAPIFHVMSLVA